MRSGATGPFVAVAVRQHWPYPPAIRQRRSPRRTVATNCDEPAGLQRTRDDAMLVPRFVGPRRHSSLHPLQHSDLLVVQADRSTRHASILTPRAQLRARGTCAIRAPRDRSKPPSTSAPTARQASAPPAIRYQSLCVIRPAVTRRRGSKLNCVLSTVRRDNTAAARGAERTVAAAAQRLGGFVTVGGASRVGLAKLRER
jgi:hypothetical protein